jgi:hypothetical protein
MKDYSCLNPSSRHFTVPLHQNSIRYNIFILRKPMTFIQETFLSGEKFEQDAP